MADGLGFWGLGGEASDDAGISSNTGYPVPRVVSLSAACYFHGMSWMNIPKDRQAVFIPPQPLPGGLLGGSEGPKLSKLQKLAAARKKRTDVKGADDKVDRTEKRICSLTINESPKENERPASGVLAKRQKLSADAKSQPSAPPQTLQHSSSASQALSGINVDTAQGTPNQELEQAEDESFVVPSSTPSAFAATLFGPGQDSAAASQTYALPYTTSSTFVASAFSQPSPDDIVLAAQAKGSRFAKTQ